MGRMPERSNGADSRASMVLAADSRTIKLHESHSRNKAIEGELSVDTLQLTAERVGKLRGPHLS